MKPKAIIVDIDGTVATRSLCCPNDVKLENKSHGHRGIHDYNRVGEDQPRKVIIDIVQRYNDDPDVVVLFTSGRPNSCRDLTREWLDKNGLWKSFRDNSLVMRVTGDYRRDDIVKKELYEEYIKPYFDVLFCLDDRDRVVKMWREEGLVCLQVAKGDF